MRVLVTGASGFIGKHLVNSLVNKGYKVRIFVREIFPSVFPPDVEVYVGDITDAQAVISAAKNCAVIFHLAAVVSYAKKDLRSIKNVNIGGTKNIINAAIKQKVKKIIYVSSASTLGISKTNKKLLNEQSVFIKTQSEGYPESKQLGEVLIRAVSKKINAVILNPSLVFGTGAVNTSSSAILQSVSNRTILFAPPGGCSIVTVEDVIDGIMQAFKYGTSGEKYILSGMNISYKSLFLYITQSIKCKKPLVVVIPYLFFYPLFYFIYMLEFIGVSSVLPGFLTSQSIYFLFHYRYLDNSKAKKELGWYPKNDFVTAFKEMCVV